MDELIVSLMRQFGWTLEYTTNLVNTLPLNKLQALVKEFRFQESMSEYRTAQNFAMVIANWASAQGKKKYRIRDFIGDPPRRENQKEPDLWDIAKQKGIFMPEEDNDRHTKET